MPPVAFLVTAEPADARVGALRAEGLEAHHLDGAEGVVEALPSAGPAAVVADVALPGRSGLDLCRRLLGARPHDVVVLLRTPRDDAFDRILALEAGADDAVGPSVGPRELALRVRALLLRLRRAASGPTRSWADVENRVAELRGHRLSLPLSEAVLLDALLDPAPGVARSRAELQLRLDALGEPPPRLAGVITRLRRRLVPAGVALIVVRGGQLKLVLPAGD